MGCNSSKEKFSGTTKRSDLLFDRYELIKGKKGHLGEGSFSVVQKATDVTTGADVAIKYYKKQKGNKNQQSSTLKRFNRQVNVLVNLAQPLVEPKDEPTLWAARMNSLQSSRCFLELLDYTKNPSAVDLTQDTLYLAMEMADFSLKDLIVDYNECNKRFTDSEILSVTKGLIMVGAALHSKKLVHLDIKPENFMRYGKHWKLIDVDGCVGLHSEVAITDSTISFSPCYCAPEWASFLVDDSGSIKISEKLDVWSIAISLCELYSLDALFKVQYAQIFRRTGNPRKAGFRFLEWLSTGDNWMERIPYSLAPGGPDTKDRANAVFRDLLSCMLKTSPRDRTTMAHLLSHEFVENTISQEMPIDVVNMRKRRERALEPVSQRPPLLKGCLHKLNSDSDPKDPDNWLKRDMWLGHNGSLCYFSPKYQKRLVYIDANVLVCAEVKQITENCAMEHAFQLKLPSSDDGEYETVCLATETATDLEVWLKQLENCSHFNYKDVETVRFSAGFIADFRKFQLQVRNRRENLADHDTSFEPIHTSDLYKLNQEGDPMNEECWTFRKMWIAKNGSLCYESKKETKNLQYFTASDMENIIVTPLTEQQTCHEFGFLLQLPAVDGLEYAPAYFAATSLESREEWMSLLRKKKVEKNAIDKCDGHGNEDEN